MICNFQQKKLKYLMSVKSSVYIQRGSIMTWPSRVRGRQPQLNLAFPSQGSAAIYMLLFGLICFLPITCKFTTSYCCGLIGFLPLNFPTVFTYRFFATKLDSKPLNRKFTSSYCCGLTSFLPLNCTAGLLQPCMDHPTQVIPPNTKN